MIQDMKSGDLFYMILQIIQEIICKRDHLITFPAYQMMMIVLHRRRKRKEREAALAAAAAQQVVAKEEVMLDQIVNSHLDRSWVDPKLDELKVEIN